MPLTDDLGKAIRDLLGAEWPKGYEGASFEEQLTILSTPLPFLEGHENTARRALAERITAELARELEQSGSAATMGEALNWLVQLVALWHAEKAIVLTFNYDTIVEHAVTSLRPVIVDGESAQSLHGSRVVYPSPRAAATITYRDMDGPAADSLQLLKLHGSVNWFWSLSDGNTLVREPYIEGFSEQPDHRAAALSGTQMLDRFLIPPVLSKDSYYNVNLVHTLWREAYMAVKCATRLTVIGYSMPQGDRVAADLLRHLPDGTPVDIVNWNVGAVTDATSPLGRAAAVDLKVDGTWDGDDAVVNFVASRLDGAVTALKDNRAIQTADQQSVLVSVQTEAQTSLAPSFVLYDMDGSIQGIESNRRDASMRTDASPIDAALPALPSGTAVAGDFYTGSRLRNAVADGESFRVNIADHEYIAIDATATSLGQWDVLELSVVPT